jgi:hypothetical protein
VKPLTRDHDGEREVVGCHLCAAPAVADVVFWLPGEAPDADAAALCAACLAPAQASGLILGRHILSVVAPGDSAGAEGDGA